jgi:signal transduction histidine kinase
MARNEVPSMSETTAFIESQTSRGGPRRLNGRLIHAYEQERLRIARELHDDFGQRLASLAIELSALAESSGQLPSGVRKRIHALSKRAGELGSDLHRVSHKLHPATLQRLGLASAMRVFCAELSSSRQMTIELDTCHVPDLLSHDVALCIYRVAQEALHNVARHSGTTSALVTLERFEDDLVLTVTDRGVGFDVSAAPAGSSIGLHSMHERVRLVDGELAIHSNIGGGTRLIARVPLRPKRREHGELVRRSKTSRAAGR